MDNPERCPRCDRAECSAFLHCGKHHGQSSCECCVDCDAHAIAADQWRARALVAEAGREENSRRAFAAETREMLLREQRAERLAEFQALQSERDSAIASAAQERARAAAMRGALGELLDDYNTVAVNPTKHQHHASRVRNLLASPAPDPYTVLRKAAEALKRLIVRPCLAGARFSKDHGKVIYDGVMCLSCSGEGATDETIAHGDDCNDARARRALSEIEKVMP